MIIQGIIELGYNIRSAWFLDIRISTCLKHMYIRNMVFQNFQIALVLQNGFVIIHLLLLLLSLLWVMVD